MATCVKVLRFGLAVGDPDPVDHFVLACNIAIARIINLEKNFHLLNQIDFLLFQ
jgi:hypothetical protein